MNIKTTLLIKKLKKMGDETILKAINASYFIGLDDGIRISENINKEDK